MAINYIVGDKLIANTSYATLNSLDLLPATREALGKATGTNLVFSVLQVGTVFGGPTLSTLYSFIRVLPLNRLGEADIRSPDYQNGRGVILYFTSDTSLNDSFEKPGSYTPDIQYLGCINRTGVTISKGKVVRQAAFDAVSQLPTVELADATTANRSHWLGLTLEDAIDGAEVSVLMQGSYQSEAPGAIDTSTALVSDAMYLSVTPGEVTPIPPVAPNIVTVVGLVESVGVTGAIRLSPGTAIQGVTGIQGSTGVEGLTGLFGNTGIAGPSGSGSAAEFFGTAPGDYAATIAIGAPFPFPSDGPILGANITRIGPTEFNLVAIGTYLISWQMSVDEPGQTTLWTGLATGTAPVVGGRVIRSCVGRATGTNQINGSVLLTTTFADTHIAVANDASGAALTVTPLAGGTNAAAAYLIIQQIA